MKKITYGARRLMQEYKGMHKPDGRTLLSDTLRIVGISVIAAILLKIADTGFAALLGAVL